MIGKKNIIFGFFFLAISALLGPIMIISYTPQVGEAASQKQQKVGAIQQAANDGFEIDLEPMTAKQIAEANTHAILSLSSSLNSQAEMDDIKGGPHAHGNLESLLNIVVGIFLSMVTANAMLKQVVSWLFILGTLLHSGLLYLSRALGQTWADSIMASPIGPVGPALILIGLILCGIVAIQGYRGEPVKDGLF